jgi:hypothetical protein
MQNPNKYLDAYWKGRDDCADGKPPQYESDEPELVEAYYDGYNDERDCQTLIAMGR